MSVERMRKLLNLLPKDDPEIGKRLLARRDFGELSLLVWSDVVKVERAQARKNCPEEYRDIDLMGLYDLKALVDKYNVDSLYGEEEEELF